MIERQKVPSQEVLRAHTPMPGVWFKAFVDTTMLYPQTNMGVRAVMGKTIIDSLKDSSVTIPEFYATTFTQHQLTALSAKTEKIHTVYAINPRQNIDSTRFNQMWKDTVVRSVGATINHFSDIYSEREALDILSPLYNTGSEVLKADEALKLARVRRETFRGSHFTMNSEGEFGNKQALATMIVTAVDTKAKELSLPQEQTDFFLKKVTGFSPATIRE